MPPNRAASRRAEPSTGMLFILVPAMARSEKSVVTPATKMAHHMATLQAFLASSGLLTSGQNQFELFMGTPYPRKLTSASVGGYRTGGQVFRRTYPGRKAS